MAMRAEFYGKILIYLFQNPLMKYQQLIIHPQTNPQVVQKYLSLLMHYNQVYAWLHNKPVANI